MTDTLDPKLVAAALEQIAHSFENPPAPQSSPATLVDAAVSLVKPDVAKEEGDVLNAYLDPAGIPTIGYGHTAGVRMGMKITQAQADMMLGQDLLHFAQGVLPLLTLIPGVGQYAALISLAFNIGVGVYATATHPGSGFKGSSVLREHNAGNPQAAADAFLLWDKAHVNGALVELPGLLSRRQAERAMYLKG